MKKILVILLLLTSVTGFTKVIKLSNLSGENICRRATATVNLVSTGPILLRTMCITDNLMATRLSFSENIDLFERTYSLHRIYLPAELNECLESLNYLTSLSTAQVEIVAKCEISDEGTYFIDPKAVLL